MDQLGEVSDGDLVAIQVDVGETLRFLEVNGNKFAVLSLLLLVDQIKHCYVLQQASCRRYQEVLHGDTGVH